jgi:hypothetical protein
MLCIACGAEMRLMQAVPDTTMMVTGYEHHTLQCTGCNEIERRLVFTREKTPVANVPVPPVLVHPAEPPPPIDRGAAAPSAWARTVAKLRGRPTDPAS